MRNGSCKNRSWAQLVYYAKILIFSGIKKSGELSADDDYVMMKDKRQIV